MIVVAICDDDRCVQGKIETILLKLKNKIPDKLRIETFSDGCGILEKIKSGHHYDIIFMDIVMNELNGIDASKKIREIDKFAQLIYVTSHDSYMKEVIQFYPIGFLSKPIIDQELEECFLNALNYILNQDELYRFEYKRNGYAVPIKDILYFQSNLREINIVCVNKRCTKYGKLSDVEKELAKLKSQFYKIHRTYLVNLRYIFKFTYSDVTLINGTILPVSRIYRKPLAELFKRI